MVIKRATMAAVTALATVNVWTGCPLLALWVGSQAVGTHDLSMAAIVVVLIVLAMLEAAMLLLLTWLSSVYDELIGLQRSESELTWIRRLCAPPEAARARRGMQLTSVEGVVVINVYVAVGALAGWYVFSLL
ncbi:MAG TPA: hypothetical protein VGH09_09130 [Solirubrobacteraceae bacterium]|jgi:hypothetical protein